jgi:hypothetical protein
MFVAPSGSSPVRSPTSPTDRARARESLALLAERARPLAASQTRLLPVIPALAGLFPDGALRRGTTIVVGDPGPGAGSGPAGGGSVSVALALVAAASAAGSWCALVGLDGLGAVAAHDIGIDLGRLAVIPRPQAAWAEVTASVIDGVDLVVLFPPFPPRPAMARRLVARARDRRSVLVVGGRAGWPVPPDVRLGVTDTRWDGVGTGEGYLHRRRVTLTATGRRSADRQRRCHLWLPSPTGTAVDVDQGTDHTDAGIMGRIADRTAGGAGTA